MALANRPAAMDDAQEVLVRALGDPSCYDHPVDRVELIETHISRILLAGAYAYKIKKPVNLGFLDFGSLDKRRFYCAEEMRLNARLAPQLYLAVVGITGTPERPAVNGAGQAIEYAVKMARFPQPALLDRLLAAGRLGAEIVDAVAAEVARFHAAVAVAPVPDGLGTAQAVHQPVRENFAHIAERAAGRPETALLEPLREWSESQFSRLSAVYDARRAEGFVRECHGDLHLGNMALIDGKVTLFDCIEFNPALRWIDIMSDTAFAAMELEDRGRPNLARRFLDVYLEHCGDFAGLRVLRYYQVYRAMVRAKVACIRAAQAASGGAAAGCAWREAGAYLSIAERLARGCRPWLAVTCGLSGSGKSTAARLLMERTGAIRLRSDVERKRLFGLAAQERSRSGLDQSLYAPDAHVRTYRRLDALAREVLQCGYPAIVDAAFLKRSQREAFHALAREAGVPFAIVELRADAASLRERILRRERTGVDASEATLRVLEGQLKSAEPLAAEERKCVASLNSGPSMANEVDELARRLVDNPEGFCEN